MTKEKSNYPNKADLEPNIDMHLADATYQDELPLSDPAESNATEVFRNNESTPTGENQPSAFGQNMKEGMQSEFAKENTITLDKATKIEKNFDVEAHTKWNEQKPSDPFKP